MDIKDILSPSEREISRSITSTPSSPKQSPLKYIQRTHSGPVHPASLKHASAGSYLPPTTRSQPVLPGHVISSANQNASSPLISPIPASSSHPHYTRASSTQSIDALADLASMQNHQPLRSTPLMRGRSYESQHSPSFHSPIPAALTSNPRASFDINMLDAPKQMARTNFSRTSLTAEKQERLSHLSKHVQEHPSAYDSHVEIIKILHDGLVDHIYPTASPDQRRDPRTYDLINDLRNAREQMEKMFAVGEDLWNDWLQDESLLARSAEERTAVVEKCQRAVEEEVGSIKLWLAFGEWVHHCYNWAHDAAQEHDGAVDEERMVGRELFSWELVLDTWQEAVKHTSHDLAQSHLIWNKYLELRAPNLQEKLKPDQIPTVRLLFQTRLQQPHLRWEDTFQAFSSFVSANLDSRYEQIMFETNRAASRIKDEISAREPFEAAIQLAQESGDRDSEYLAFTRYIEWETIPEKRKKPDLDRVDALYQRAELRFPSDTSLWEDHLMFLQSKSRSNLLPLLECATKHCPWSGSLWSHYLLTSDRIGQTFQETEGIKHKATNTGILEAAGIEEIISVHAAWCSYLRRRSSRPEGSEEDIDVAEMGIRSSIETVSSLGVKLGLGEAPGSSFRLRRIYITFLTDSGRWDNARHEFDSSVREFGSSYEFWMQFYQWEMMRWRRFASTSQATQSDQPTSMPPPEMATAVLKKAIEQPNLDYPEPILRAFVTHCEDHADVDELQQALFKTRQAQKQIETQRQLEMMEAEKAGAAEREAQSMRDHASTTTLQGEKRKREAGVDDDEGDQKKRMKSEETSHASIEQNTEEALKRDREHGTVLVQNLPDAITDVKIRRYFSACGVVRSLKVIRDGEVSAIIEFEDDMAAKYALSRDGQQLDDAILSVVLDTGSTVYLANYKPSADETYIRDLLKAYGDIISVRFPSLQGNKRRRFCYVQFKLPAEAQAATERDGKDADGFTLVCKISDPAGKKKRDERKNVNDGRTIFIGQLNFKITEAELEEVFSTYGAIDTIRMPRNDQNKSRNKGIAFITYGSKDSATMALQSDGREVKDRPVKVRLATNEPSRSTARSTASPAPGISGRMESPNDSLAASTDLSGRQVFLTNIPDTVNESRLQAIAADYGSVVRVILKTNHQGAILEYATAADAGLASLKLGERETDPGRTIRVVSEQEMQSMTREKKTDQFFGSKHREPSTVKAAPIGQTAPIRRPGQTSRKGGHLGQRTVALMSSQADRATDDDAKTSAKKSNSDFRAMLK